MIRDIGLMGGRPLRRSEGGRRKGGTHARGDRGFIHSLIQTYQTINQQSHSLA
jgi:hypothetical protein